MSVPQEPIPVDRLVAMTPEERRASLEASLILDPHNDERMTPEMWALVERVGPARLEQGQATRLVTDRRRVVVADTVFDAIDAQVRPERGPNGEPSAASDSAFVEA